MANKDISVAIIIRILKGAAINMQERHVKQLRDLDAAIGDGDLGITIKKGFKAVKEVLSTIQRVKISKMLQEVGMAFNDAAPSTFGSFFAIAFIKASRIVRDKETVDVQDLNRMFQAAVQGIADKGRAKLGDKTMLDALIPASEAIHEVANHNGTIYEALQKATAASAEGVKKTKKLRAKMGRARSLGKRTQGIQDPGATAVYLLLSELLHAISKLQGL